MLLSSTDLHHNGIFLKLEDSICCVVAKEGQISAVANAKQLVRTKPWQSVVRIDSRVEGTITSLAHREATTQRTAVLILTPHRVCFLIISPTLPRKFSFEAKVLCEESVMKW
jgi:hypothetical protein